MLCEFLGAVSGTMLAAGAAKGHLQMRESPLQETVHVGVHDGEHVAKESQHLAVVLEELLHLPVKTGHAAETLVLAGVVDGAAVEDVAASISGQVLRYAFLERETVYMDVKSTVGSLRQAGAGGSKASQDVRKVRIAFKRLVEQFLKVLERIGDALQEMRALLDPPPESVGPQDLKCTEKDEDPQGLLESVPVHGHISLQRIEVLFDKLLLEVFRIARPGLPHERSDIIVQRPAASALEIDEPRLSVVKHHVACLEIPVHKAPGTFLEKVGLEQVEIILETLFVELYGRRLQETVLEVIEVEIDHPGIEGLGGIADAEVQAFCTEDLHGWQGSYGVKEQRALPRAIGPGGACFRKLVIEQPVAKVLLEIGHPVAADGEHFGHADALRPEMPGQGDERPVLVPVGTGHSDKGYVTRLQAVISPAAAGL